MKEVEPDNSTSNSFVIKCLLKTVRFMWQVTAIPSKIGETFGTLYRYAQESVDTILCVAGKARRKERDGDQNATDTKLYLEESVLERKLPEADLKALVDLPAGLDYNEWLASHTLALFEHVNLVYGTISEFCTPSGCTDMTGPGNRTYLWFDEKGKKTRVAAPQYIDYVMTFTQKTVSDETIFPTKYANEFPSSFESIARKILRLQFHVIAHLYAMHFREIALLGLHTHLNLTFAHLTALHRRFNLIDEKETDVLRDLEVALRLTDDSAASTTSGSTSTINTTASNAGGGGGSGGAASQSHEQSGGLDAPHHDGGGGNKLKQQQLEDAAVIDGDANSPPICTQPEAATKANSCCLASNGGGNLTTGILGDLTSSEFGDNNRYYTSAVPSSATAAASDPATAAAAALAAAAAALNSNNQGAGALQFNNPAVAASTNGTGGGGGGGANNHHNNNNNIHQQHTHHHHPHHHHHHHHNPHHHHYGHHPHLHPHPPNSGLIQCNAAGGGAGVGVGVVGGAVGVPGGAVASGASNNAATAGAATAAAHTTAA